MSALIEVRLQSDGQDFRWTAFFFRAESTAGPKWTTVFYAEGSKERLKAQAHGLLPHWGNPQRALVVFLLRVFARMDKGYQFDRGHSQLASSLWEPAGKKRYSKTGASWLQAMFGIDATESDIERRRLLREWVVASGKKARGKVTAGDKLILATLRVRVGEKGLNASNYESVADAIEDHARVRVVMADLRKKSQQRATPTFGRAVAADRSPIEASRDGIGQGRPAPAGPQARKCAQWQAELKKWRLTKVAWFRWPHLDDQPICGRFAVGAEIVLLAGSSRRIEARSFRDGTELFEFAEDAEELYKHRHSFSLLPTLSSLLGGPDVKPVEKAGRVGKLHDLVGVVVSSQITDREHILPRIRRALAYEDIAVSRDGVTLAACRRADVRVPTGEDYCVDIWDLNTGLVRRTIDPNGSDYWQWASSLPKPVECRLRRRLAMTPDGSQIACTTSDGICLLSTRTGKLEATLGCTDGWACDIFFGGLARIWYSPKGEYVLAGGVREPVHVWRLADSQEITTWRGKTQIRDIIFSHDGATCVTGGFSSEIHFLAFPSGESKGVIRLKGASCVIPLGFLADEAVLAVFLSRETSPKTGRPFTKGGKEQTKDYVAILETKEGRILGEARLPPGRSVYDSLVLPSGQVRLIAAKGGPFAKGKSGAAVEFWRWGPEEQLANLAAK